MLKIKIMKIIIKINLKKMLPKNKIDKQLRNYIKEHLSKGYTKHAVKKTLVSHGYDENYVDGLLKKHSQIQFIRRYAIVVSLLFVISVFAFNLLPMKSQSKITGFAVISTSDEGCCTAICQQTAKQECYGNFIENKKCDELQECTVGCCIDKEGYCLTNYLYSNCIANEGINIYRDCSEIIYCRNLTNTQASKYAILSKAGFGVADVEPIAGYYGSSFAIKFYFYDKLNIASITANIKDSAEAIDAITLYDDGSHNDGASNDNLYANNWLNSKLAFSGFKNLGIDITIQFADDTTSKLANAASFVVLNNNRCLPIFTKWSASNTYNLIFASYNYHNLSNGFQKFEDDVDNALSIMFSTEPFLISKDSFNVYRFEEALSYFNTQTLLALISSSCPNYSNKNDLVIIFDNSEQYCIPQGTGVIRVNPQILFYKNITSAGINETLTNFCSYALTPKMLADNLLKFATPPSIIIHTSDNITYLTGEINFSFAIQATNFPVDYSVYLDTALISAKTTNQGVTESINLNLANGTNLVLIAATDKNKNSAFAQVFLNASI